MATFALVHGAWHSASCWDPLVPTLEARGHETIAVDLPCDDETATFDSYADVVAQSLQDRSDIILVGHSLAGHTIPLVAAQVEVRRLVFLCALIAEPGRSLVDQMSDEPGMLLPQYVAGLSEADDRGRRRWTDRAVATEVMYADCNPDDADRALDALRPQATTPYTAPCSLQELPSTDRTYIVCSADRLVNPEWSRRAAIDRLGIEAVELSGSHSPFLSQPEELGRLLHSLA